MAKFTPNNRNKAFWAIWNKAVEQFKAAHLTKEEIEQERQEILKLAGAKPDDKGRYSTKNLTNGQFNTVLDLIETTILKEDNQKRRSKSLIWSIEQTGLDDPYLDKIAQDQFKVTTWRNCNIVQLSNLRMTAKARATK